MLGKDSNKLTEKGITLLEAMISTAIVGIGFIAVFQMVNYSIHSINISGERTKINYLTAMVAEDLIGDRFTRNNKDEKIVIEALISSTEDLEDTFYLSNDIPYEIELWKKLIPKVAKEVFCNSENILRSDFMPERSISRIYNNIKLVGRYDLKYKMNNQIAIVDFKV